MRVTLPSGTPGELARPDGPQPDRGLVLVPDIMGMRPLMDDHVARLSADNDWVVCAFELWPGHEVEPLEWRQAHARELVDRKVIDDAIEAADLTGAEDVSILGFCMGGMYALKAAGTGRFWRAVSFYGMIRVPEAWQGPDQVDALDSLASAYRCPTLEIAGTDDPLVPEADLRAAEALGVEVVRYEGAQHGFAHDPHRPTHRAEDAADAWRRATDFLSR